MYLWLYLYLLYWFEISMTNETHGCLQVHRVKGVISFFFRWFPDNLSFEDLKLLQIVQNWWSVHTTITLWWWGGLGKEGRNCFQRGSCGQKRFLWPKLLGEIRQRQRVTCGELASEFDLNRRGRISWAINAWAWKGRFEIKRSFFHKLYDQLDKSTKLCLLMCRRFVPPLALRKFFY